MSLGTEKKKKKLYRLTGMGPQIVGKILSDGNWVIIPNGCEKLSDEWWVMSYELWVMSDQKSEAKQPLRDQKKKTKNKKQKKKKP